MKIQIVTDDGKVVDTYEGVVFSDIESEAFGKPIRDWMWKTLRKADTFPIHAEDRNMETRQREAKEKAERCRAQLRKLEGELRDAGCLVQAARFTPDQDEIDNTVTNVVVQIWSDDKGKWLDYSRDTWAAVDRFKQTLLHSGSPTRQYRAVADYGNGEVLWNMKD